MSVKFKIDDKAFQKSIDKIINLFGDKEIKAILRKSARPLVNDMRKSTQWLDYTGEAREAIKSMTFSRSKSYFVGPKLGNFISVRKRRGRYRKYDPYYMKFIDQGFTNWRSGIYYGPTNFIQKALDSSRSEVLSKVKSLVYETLGPFG